MRVSVIIPTYNSGVMVASAIESVLAQSHAATQIIVVDDGSTDNTQERLSSFGERIECVRQANAGVAAARNAGLARATGDVIAFLDADDAWHPHKLQRQLATLHVHPAIGLLATQTFCWPGPLPMLEEPSGEELEVLPLERLLVCNRLVTSSIVIRREILAQAGPFDCDLHGPEDYDLWLRCAQIAGVAVLRQRLTGYRDTAGSLGKQADSMRRGCLRIHQKLDKAALWPSAALRRKCRAHLDYSTGYLYFASGQPGRAAKLLAQSLFTYPLPMSAAEVRYRWGRLRLLVRAVWRECRRKLPIRAEEQP